MLVPGPLTPGMTLDCSFEILRLAARGGEATVYQARVAGTDRLAAVKAIAAEDPRFAEGTRRLAHEHQVLGALAGLPSFLVPLAYRVTDDFAYLAMEWLDGASDGDEFIKGRCPLDTETWLWVARHTTMALLECHRHGFLHCDVKPRNILISDSGVLKLIDFGIARDERYVTLRLEEGDLGSISYLPPEQVTEGQASVQGEMFALGVSLYEFLTGLQPFAGDSAGEIMRRKLDQDFLRPSKLNPDVPPWVDRLIECTLDPRPERRPQGAREALALLTVGDAALPESCFETLRPCQRCRERLWPGLNFCTHCGLAYQLEIAPGSWAVVAERIDDPELFARGVEEATRSRLTPWRRRLFAAEPPRVVVDGVDRASAELIASGLSSENTRVVAGVMDTRDRLATARFSPLQMLLVGIALALLAWGVLATPSRLSLHPSLPGFVFSGTFLILATAGGLLWFLAREVLSPLVPRDAFAVHGRRPPWGFLPGIAQSLNRLSDAGLRRRASALVRRMVRLHNHVAALSLSPSARKDMVASLERITAAGLERLASLDQSGTALREVRKSGVAKKRATLEAALLKSDQPEVVMQLADRLAELARLDAAHSVVLRRHAADERVFSSILAEANSLLLTVRLRGPEQWRFELESAVNEIERNREVSDGGESRHV